VLLMVSRDRDGRSYSNRRVIAVQNGVVIFNMAASFQVSEESAASGRGMYTGRIFGRDGSLAAGIAQESLFRPGRRPRGPLAE
jgi:acyl-CoA thioesterase